jgi:hypothetical protein
MRVNSDFVLNDIDESELQFEKQHAQRIWTWWGIVMFNLLPKDRINCVYDESRMKSDQMVKCESFDSTEITILERNKKAEPPINPSSRQNEEVEGSQPRTRNQEAPGWA